MSEFITQAGMHSYEAAGRIENERFVKMASGHTVEQCDAAGEGARGVSRYGCDEGDALTVATTNGDEVMVTTGDAYDDMVELATDDEGRAVEAAGGDVVVALAREASTGEGQSRLVQFLGAAQYTKAGGGGG